MQTYEAAGIVAATILGIDAAIHVYWLTGRTWPARDRRTLSQVVLNANVPFTPRVLIPLVLILAGAGTTILVRANGGGAVAWLPTWIPIVGTIAVAAGAFLRACAGVVWALGIGSRKGTMFHTLNIVAYTPSCLILCGAATLVAFRP